MLAVKSRHRHKLIENAAFANSIRRSVALTDRFDQLHARRHTHLPHHPLHGHLGSILDEATILSGGANQARQCVLILIVALQSGISHERGELGGGSSSGQL
jgi:hypothetical protein